MSNFILQKPLVQKLEPFLVVSPINRPGCNLSPFGMVVPEANVFDPTRMDSEPFCNLLQSLDGRTFGPEGMPMDKWVFYDICYMPGAVFGFGKHSSQLSDRAKEVFALDPDYEGLVPYAMYIAIPMAEKGAWMGHNLASIAPLLPEEKLRGLGTLTKAMGLKCFQTRNFYGATQWSSTALYIHVKFGPIDLLTAYTPAHSEAKTLTYRFEASDHALLAAVGNPEYSFDRPEPELWIEARDTEAMIALQDRIEAGERFLIPSAPRREDGRIEVPVSSTS